MVRLGKKELENLGPGWFWDYEGGEGFKGKHFINIQTGATLSVRQGQAVQRQQQTLHEAMVKRYEGLSEAIIEGQQSKYAVVKFRSLEEAIAYASHILQPNYIVAYGQLRIPYPDETGGFGYRSLMPGRRDYTFYQRAANIAGLYKEFNEKFIEGPFDAFYVWENIG